MKSRHVILAFALVLSGCPEGGDGKQTTRTTGPTAAAGGDPALKELANRAKGYFPALPAEDPGPASNEVTDEKVALGHMLYFDTRLSKGQGISCNSCHDLARFGVDGEPTSPGHRGQRGDRNSPTVLNAALQFAQFWDGRASTVEEQATMPITNPVEMAMADPDTVLKVIKSVPGYEPLFKAAFPDAQGELVTMEHVGKAIGAFERRLLTPSRYDEFVNGKHDALTEQEVRGLKAYLEVNCQQCHTGALLGGNMYQKMGLKKPYPALKDVGRMKVTGQKSDEYMFKVPTLRNVTKTGPYMHDGSIASLEEVVEVMAEYQLGVTLPPERVADIVAFMGALEGKVDEKLAAKPEMPPNGPNTPAADPN
jgi:cytochrome c peroxidase